MNKTWWILLPLGLLLIWGSGRLHPTMHSLRWGGQEPDEVQLDEDTDPTVKLVTVMLGPFRGVIADVLWIRASRLQDEGKYFELVQLASLITKLEPRFPEVWDYHGWNMAYNVSVYFEDPEERWRWVQNGFSLLRDEGLKYNPANPSIHDSLAWTFQHKIGMNSDDAHRYYKKALFEEMDRVIPGGRLDAVDFPDEVLDPAAPSPYRKKDYDRMLEQGVITTNVHSLITHYKMRPRVMKLADAEYGPFDWRLPHAQSVYWAFMGLQYSGESGHNREQLHRRISQSMMQQFERGQFIIMPNSRLVQFFPNLDLMDRVVKSYNSAIEDAPEQQTFRMGRNNFLRAAIPTLHLFEREREARYWYDQLQILDPNPIRPPYETFVQKLNAKEIETLTTLEAFNLITGNLARSIHLKDSNPDEALRRMQEARSIYAAFEENRISSEKQKARIGLGSWEDLLWAGQQLAAAQAASRPSPLLPVP